MRLGCGRGHFSSLGEAVAEAINSLKSEDEALGWAKPLVDEGLVELDRGDSIPGQEEVAPPRERVALAFVGSQQIERAAKGEDIRLSDAKHYNAVRLHSSLGCLTPEEFPAKYRQTTDAGPKKQGRSIPSIDTDSSPVSNRNRRGRGSGQVSSSMLNALRARADA